MAGEMEIMHAILETVRKQFTGNLLALGVLLILLMATSCTISRPFTVTDVTQMNDYCLIYVQIGSVDADTPILFSQETVHAIHINNELIPMAGAAPAKDIVASLSAFTITKSKEGDLEIGLPEGSGEIRLLGMLPRPLEKLEIALAFHATKKELHSLQIGDVELELPKE